MKAIAAIYLKELKDALRDRRTLMMVLVSATLTVPLMLLIFSIVMSQVESQQIDRTVYAVNMKDAPRLENFILRQAYDIKQAPPDYEAQSRSKALKKPVLIVPEKFEEKIQSMESSTLEMAYDTSNRQAEMGVHQLQALLQVYAQEERMNQLTMRGISSDLWSVIAIKEKHLTRPDERKVTIMQMIPMVLIMSVVMGGMFVAIDSTAGERERGSLEPLMMNPVGGQQLAVGKVLAVASISAMVALLTVLSFFPAQALIDNDTLRAEFQFGVSHALSFLMVLLPLSVMIGAMQVALSLTCKSFKEANVRNQLLSMLISFLPIFLMLNPGREPEWMSYVPVLAQSQMMGQVLKGEALNPINLILAFAVCMGILAASLYFIAKKIRQVVME